jgi:hypothetical protein
MPAAHPGIASVTGEHGSFGAFIEGHVWNDLGPVGVGNGAKRLSPPEFLERYADSIEKLKALQAQGLGGSQYFEMFDVEEEEQGFITYDRELAKVAVAEIARLNAQLVPLAKNYAAATDGFSIKTADSTPESKVYAARLGDYRKGKRNSEFLRRLALMALRQNDQAEATVVGDAYIVQAPRPYSRGTWATIAAITRTSQDEGFELLRSQTRGADAALGAQAAEKKLVEIIRREALGAFLNDPQTAFDWTAVETSSAARYGALGREAVLGAKMIDDWRKRDWLSFGQSYTRYFATALPRSTYPHNNASYQVLEHVDDRRVLETALRVMKRSIDSDKPDSVFGRYDPTELDTYANLLYKVGHKADALAWQRQAVAVSDGRDQEIIEHFQKMKSGEPTWPAH